MLGIFDDIDVASKLPAVRLDPTRAAGHLKGDVLTWLGLTAEQGCEVQRDVDTRAYS